MKKWRVFCQGYGRKGVDLVRRSADDCRNGPPCGLVELNEFKEKLTLVES